MRLALAIAIGGFGFGLILAAVTTPGVQVGQALIGGALLGLGAGMGAK